MRKIAAFLRRAWALIVCMVLVFPLSVSAEQALLLRGKVFASLEDVSAAIKSAGAVKTVDLTDAILPMEVFPQLWAAFPAVDFLYTVDIWGTSISSAETSAALDKKYVRDADFEQLKAGLAALPRLTRADMWHTRMSYKQRKTLFDAFPHIFFGWTIQLNNTHSVRTDATAFSTRGRKPKLNSVQPLNFEFCQNLLALDIGHNYITKSDFLYALPNLRILILADDRLSDITPIGNMQELEYLELFINRVRDISPLANCLKLKDVNLADNLISDLSPLYHLPHLERVWIMTNPLLKAEEIERLRQHQPDCEIVVRANGATGNIQDDSGKFLRGTSWRHHPRYDTVYYVFNGGGYVDWDYPVPDRVTN